MLTISIKDHKASQGSTLEIQNRFSLLDLKQSGDTLPLDDPGDMTSLLGSDPEDMTNVS